MRALIRTMQYQGGREIGIDRELVTDRLLIGRGANQHLQIPDMRIPLSAGELVLGRDRRAILLLRAGALVSVEGKSGTEVPLAVGDVVTAGRYRITFAEPEGGADLMLVLEERMSAGDERAELRRSFRTRLNQTRLNMRAASWALFCAVVLAGLAVPASTRYVGGASGLGDQFWISGPISKPHSHFGGNCGRCHEAPFVAVRNDVCTTCHRNTPHHSDDATILRHSDFEDMRCASCHREHNREEGLIARHPDLCADCHARPERTYPGLGLQAAADFRTLHPEFSPRVSMLDPATGRYSWRTGRAPMNQLSEDTGLHFPHDKHLLAKGVKSPDGRRVLDCADCHMADAGGVSFQPVSMERHCVDCHRLEWDPDDPSLTVPHADATRVAAMVRGHFARKALAGGVTDPQAPQVVRERRRPDQALQGNAAAQALTWADTQADRALHDIFERRICGVCHVVSKADREDAPWRIAPVELSEHALSGARFSHAAHRTERCASCHAADQSTQSSDVLLPEIQTCRDCHGGVSEVRAVSSTCVMCHGFHVAKAHWREDAAVVGAP
jgi:hypothetical protein